MKRSNFRKVINSILESHSFGDNYDVLKFIMQQNSKSEYLKVSGDSSSKMLKVQIMSFDNMAKLCRASEFLHYQQKQKMLC